MPPVRIKLPVPFGLIVILTLASVPADSIVALLEIFNLVAGAPISIVSAVELINKNGSFEFKVLSTSILLVVTISFVPSSNLDTPPAVNPKRSEDAWKIPVVAEDSNFNDGSAAVPSYKSIIALLTLLFVPLAVRFPVTVASPPTDKSEPKVVIPDTPKVF